MSRSTILEAWSGIDAYATEIDEFLAKVLTTRSDRTKVMVVDQLLPQAVRDAAELQRTCIAFLEMLGSCGNTVDYQELVVTADRISTWLQNMLILHNSENGEMATEEIVSDGMRQRSLLHEIKDEAAVCAANAGISRTEADEELGMSDESSVSEAEERAGEFDDFLEPD